MATAIDRTSGDMLHMGARHQIAEDNVSAPENAASLMAPGPCIFRLAYLACAILASPTGRMSLPADAP